MRYAQGTKSLKYIFLPKSDKTFTIHKSDAVGRREKLRQAMTSEFSEDPREGGNGAGSGEGGGGGRSRVKR